MIYDEIQMTQHLLHEALIEAGRLDKRVVVMDADLGKSTRSEHFRKQFPDRIINVGIAEQNMMATAAGLALSGKIPYVCSFAAFATKRTLDQINVSVAYSNANVRILGVEPGISSGRNGATHMAVDDMAMLRAMPRMTVVDPGDASELRQVILKSIDYQGPMYIRIYRENLPIIYKPEYDMQIGKGVEMLTGHDAYIIACGALLYPALCTARKLRTEGLDVGLIDMHTIKPLDEQLICEAAAKSGALVVCENHSIYGGLGGAVAEVCARKHPTPIEFVGVNDAFGETGTNQYLFHKYGLDEEAIEQAVRRVMKRKNG